jgi:hypothetical protein
LINGKKIRSNNKKDTPKYQNSVFPKYGLSVLSEFIVAKIQKIKI